MARRKREAAGFSAVPKPQEGRASRSRKVLQEVAAGDDGDGSDVEDGLEAPSSAGEEDEVKTTVADIARGTSERSVAPPSSALGDRAGLPTPSSAAGTLGAASSSSSVVVAPSSGPSGSGGMPAGPTTVSKAHDDGLPAKVRRRMDKFPRLMRPDGSATLRCSENASDGSYDFRAECLLCGATKSRTCRPGTRGQGRPFGMLWAWLADVACAGDRLEHAACTPTYLQRRAGRSNGRTAALPMNDWSVEDFLAKERPRSKMLDDDVGEPWDLP